MNAYLIYKENDDTRGMTMLQFRESLVRSLLIGVPFENLKPGRREGSSSRAKRKLADQKLEEMEGSVRDVRRRCVGCYEKIRPQQTREANAASAKKIKTLCPDCENFFVLIVLMRGTLLSDKRKNHRRQKDCTLFIVPA